MNSDGETEPGGAAPTGGEEDGSEEEPPVEGKPVDPVKKEGGLSAGMILLILVGVVVGAIALSGVGYMVYRKIKN